MTAAVDPTAGVEALPEFVTTDEIAARMGVKPASVRIYAQQDSRFPTPVTAAKRDAYRAADALTWILAHAERWGEQRVARIRATFDRGEISDVVTRDELALLLGIKTETINRAYSADEDFPDRLASSRGQAVYRGADVEAYLRARDAGTGVTLDARVLDQQQFTLDDLAAVLGVKSRSLLTHRSQRDRDVFPKPMTDPSTGKPYSPMRFERDDVIRYVAAYLERLRNSGRVTPMLAERLLER